MDKAKAIKVLKPLANSFVDYANITMKEEDDNTAEALEMAIEVLKAQLTAKGTTSDLISRQAAIDALDKIFPADPMRNDYTQGITCGAALATEYIKQLPSAQPEPHEGYWIWVAGDLECSKCHTRYPDLYPDYDNSVACPHCGARMKGATT